MSVIGKVFKKDKAGAEAPEEQKQDVAVEQKKTQPVKTAQAIAVTNQAFRVLVRPLITEKSAELAAESKYVFEVNPAMNKVEVKKAVRATYGVEPIAVHIITNKGKQVRFGRMRGKRKDWKKAIVTLKKGQTIEVFEGV